VPLLNSLRPARHRLERGEAVALAHS